MTPAPSHRKLRSSRRQMVHSAAQINVPGDGDHTAIVRDLSAEGIFLYSNFKPEVGSDIALTFSRRVGEDVVKIFTHAKVVRVQQLVAGAAPGIAAKFTKRIDCEEIGRASCREREYMWVMA